MVGVAEAGAAAGPGPDSYYHGEFYPPAPQEFYVQSPEMCPHPHHPQHPHMCALHSDYGGVSMGVVGGGGVSLPPLLMPAVLDEGMRHYMLPPPPPPHAHHAPQQAAHHAPAHHYGGANGASGPQYYSGGGYPPPPQFHPHVPPHHLQPSPPPPLYHKDERTQRQYTKLKRRLDHKYNNRNNGTVLSAEVRSGGSTPSLSPRKEMNGNGGGSSGAWSEGECSSATASLQGDEDDTQAVLDALSAERIPQVSEITPTSALVQWSCPTSEGVPLPSMELTYELLLGDRDRYKAIYSGSSLSCRVRDLRPGTEYSLRLQIRAGELVGHASNATTFRAPPAPPAQPPAPRVTQRTRSTLLLRWGPSNENGSRILHYLVEMDTGAGFAEIAQPRTRQFTASHLQMQSEHRFRIAAVNEVGRSEWSEEIIEWTIGAPPAAPAPPRLVRATDRSLHVAWCRRADNEEFTLQMNDSAAGHGFLPVYSGRELEHTCEGLRRACDYRLRLRCETADGNGPWSFEVTFRTAPERPSPPGRPTPKGKIHSRAFRLRWDPPTDSGGAEVSSYTLELDSGRGFEAAYVGREREAHCDRLQPGTPYRARVNCLTEAGTSDWSPAETITTEPVAPAPCSAPQLASKPRATSFPVRWRPPENDGGAPVTEYRLELYRPTGDIEVVYEGSDLEYTVRDTIPGTEYKVQVSAINRAGAGAPSPQLSVVTAPAPPDPPEPPALRVEPSFCAHIEWNPPACNGADITEYRVEMSRSEVDDGYVEIYRGATAHCITGDLSPASPYFFRVCAVNSAGKGVWSRISAIVTPSAPPAAPTSLRYESTTTRIDITWKKPVDHGSEILHYRIEIDSIVSVTEGPNCAHTVEGLSPDTTYHVRIAAVNELGAGPWSDVCEATTRPPPPPAPRLECVQSAHNFLKMSWGEGVAPETTQYCLEMRAPESRDFRPAYRGSARNCKVKKLRESTTYWFRIRAMDEIAGRGESSEVVEATTLSAPPPAPRVPNIELIGSKSALVTWEPLDGVVSYVVHSAKGKEAASWRACYAGSEPRAELDDLEPGCDYSVRVCGVRAGLQGAWSTAARLSVPAPPAAPPQPARVRRVRASASFLERNAVWVYTVGFLLVAVAMALMVEWVVERTRTAP